MFQITRKSFQIIEILRLIEQNSINMSPRYQRQNGIWNENDNKLLIDSIFNGIDLPKFYFHFFPEDYDHQYMYAVIDGKQRLNAIYRFFNNEYPLAKDFRFFEEEECVNIAGMFFRDIEINYPRIAGRFLSYQLDFSIIDTDEVDRIENMFIRINKGVVVISSEKRRAYGGKLIDIISERASQNPFFLETTVIKDARYNYQELFLKLFVLELSGQIVALNNKDINSVLKERKDCNNGEERYIDIVSKQLVRISCAFGKKERLFKKNNVILLYWFLRNKNLLDGRAVSFLKQFESERLDRKVAENQKEYYYQRFNELTRQGIYKKSNMEERLDILETQFSVYRKSK